MDEMHMHTENENVDLGVASRLLIIHSQYTAGNICVSFLVK